MNFDGLATFGDELMNFDQLATFEDELMNFDQRTTFGDEPMNLGVLMTLGGITLPPDFALEVNTLPNREEIDSEEVPLVLQVNAYGNSEATMPTSSIPSKPSTLPKREDSMYSEIAPFVLQISTSEYPEAMMPTASAQSILDDEDSEEVMFALRADSSQYPTPQLHAEAPMQAYMGVIYPPSRDWTIYPDIDLKTPQQPSSPQPAMNMTPTGHYTPCTSVPYFDPHTAAPTCTASEASITPASIDGKSQPLPEKIRSKSPGPRRALPLDHKGDGILRPRGGGIRKGAPPRHKLGSLNTSIEPPKNQKRTPPLDIPAGRTLDNIDALITQCTNANDIMELKKQKRLLRNRQTA